MIRMHETNRQFNLWRRTVLSRDDLCGLCWYVVVREHYKSRAKRNEQTTSNYVIYGNRLLKWFIYFFFFVAAKTLHIKAKPLTGCGMCNDALNYCFYSIVCLFNFQSVFHLIRVGNKNIGETHRSMLKATQHQIGQTKSIYYFRIVISRMIGYGACGIHKSRMPTILPTKAIC